MRKTLTVLVALLLAGAMGAGVAAAETTPVTAPGAGLATPQHDECSSHDWHEHCLPGWDAVDRVLDKLP